MSKEDLARLDWDALTLAYALGYVNTRWRTRRK
jgi:hypothetical protein